MDDKHAIGRKIQRFKTRFIDNGDGVYEDDQVYDLRVRIAHATPRVERGDVNPRSALTKAVINEIAHELTGDHAFKPGFGHLGDAPTRGETQRVVAEAIPLRGWLRDYDGDPIPRRFRRDELIAILDALVGGSQWVDCSSCGSANTVLDPEGDDVEVRCVTCGEVTA